MDELVRLIQEKTGIDEGQARGAAETAINFIKDRLPEPIRGQIDAVLGGGAGGSGMPDLGGMLGGR